MKNKIALLLLVFFSPLLVQGQNEIGNIIEDIVANNLAASGEEQFIDMNQLRFELEQLARNPIQVNSTKMDIFTRLGVLGTEQYNALRNHINRYGKINEIEELQMIEGFDAETIRKLRPFISFQLFAQTDEFKKRTFIEETKKVFLIHYQQLLEKPAGYRGAEPKYSGNLARMMVRFNMNFYKKWRMGINLEKDAGETFGWNPERQKLGFDHVSAFLEYKGNGILKSAIVGDFQAGFGQGLTFWKGLTFGKSANSVPIRKVAPGVRPHTGIDEVNYMRGLAFKMEKGNRSLIGFVSYRKLDANPLNDTIENPVVFTSILTSGTHRTASELKNDKNLSEILGGADFTIEFGRLRLGGSFVNRVLGGELQPPLNLSRLNLFRGKSNWVGGIHVDYSLNNIHLFTEVSMSKNKNWASLAGAIMTLDPKFSLSVYTRIFQPGFQPISSLAFGESSKNQNENGIYFGFEFKLNKRNKFTGYFDLFSYPWLKSRIDAPSSGSELLGQYVFAPTKRWEFGVRYRYKKGELNETDAQKIIKKSAQQFRLQIQFKPLNGWILRSRYEVLFLKQLVNETGQLFYVDAIYQPMEKPWSGSVRYALFNTPDFDTRIYAYERDVYYTYSVKPYFGQGQKVYLNLKWQFNRYFKLIFRIGRLVYPFANSIGSGNDLIAANHRTEIKIQLRVRW